MRGKKNVFHVESVKRIVTECAVKNGDIIDHIVSCNRALHLEMKEDIKELIIEHAEIQQHKILALKKQLNQKNGCV